MIGVQHACVCVNHAFAPFFDNFRILNNFPVQFVHVSVSYSLKWLGVRRLQGKFRPKDLFFTILKTASRCTSLQFNFFKLQSFEGEEGLMAQGPKTPNSKPPSPRGPCFRNVADIWFNVPAVRCAAVRCQDSIFSNASQSTSLQGSPKYTAKNQPYFLPRCLQGSDQPVVANAPPTAAPRPPFQLLRLPH